MKWDPITRRQFLQGSKGFMLAMPFLPSLLSPSELRAACLEPSPRFLAIYSMYGNIKPLSWYPSHNQMSLTTQELRPGHLIRSGDLPENISAVFGPQYNSLRSKMCCIEGVDTVQRHGHGRG